MLLRNTRSPLEMQYGPPGVISIGWRNPETLYRGVVSMADFGWISGMTWLIQSLRPSQWMRKFLLVLYCYLTIHLALIQ